MMSPHGVPIDLLDRFYTNFNNRLLIIRTTPYNLQDIVKILAIRASTEGIQLTEGALARLGEIGNESSLRFAVLLLSPSAIHAKT